MDFPPVCLIDGLVAVKRFFQSKSRPSRGENTIWFFLGELIWLFWGKTCVIRPSHERFCFSRIKLDCWISGFTILRTHLFPNVTTFSRSIPIPPTFWILPLTRSSLPPVETCDRAQPGVILHVIAPFAPLFLLLPLPWSNFRKKRPSLLSPVKNERERRRSKNIPPSLLPWCEMESAYNLRKDAHRIDCPCGCATSRGNFA